MKKSDLELLKEQAKDLRKSLKKGKITVENLGEYISTLFIPMQKLLMTEAVRSDDFIDFLYLCLDYYTYTESVLISDYDYDLVMRVYESLGGKRMTTADPIELSTRWPLVRHEEPGVVGSIEKIYTEEELERYYTQYKWCYSWGIAPKFDGISSSIKVVDGKIVRGCTRYDGYEGQDITQVVIRAKNAHNFDDPLWMTKTDGPPKDGYYKVELCVGTSDFEELVKEKEYANRRSATSGIVNSPKNIELAKYITIIPLAYYSFDKEFYYHPRYMKFDQSIGGWKALYREIKSMLDYCNIADFEFRTDGVVIMPFSNTLVIDESDLMSNAIAFKINTKIGRTKIKDLYVSVGRMGKAVPMASIVPVEVNETRVHDVSLGSFDKAISMNLHEGEIIEVYSAGDVIPQIRLPEEKEYPKNSPYLKLDMRCPYCGNKLERDGREYFCDNSDCIRIKTGKITNFLMKLGSANISDATIEDLYSHNLIKDIPDLFELNSSDISSLEGYGEISAFNIITELVRIKNQSITIDKFFGALGIPDIGEKTARKIFSVIDVDDLTRKKEKLFMKLIVADGIGEKTANSFIKFLKKNENLVDTLMSQMNVVEMQSWKGNVVFTGMRSAELAERFNKLGYEVSENINSKTIAVITNNANMSSGKCKTALQRGIDVIFITEVEDFIKKLKKK